MAKSYGIVSTFSKMIKNILKKLFCPHKDTSQNSLELYEGWTADQYTCPELKDRISKRYRELHTRQETPYTNPEKYDPLNPPDGWKWDPYYEVWIRTE